MNQMGFSIATPSCNSVEMLSRCCASVCDQASAAASSEHLVVDAASTDGTVAWLQNRRGLAWSSEPDSGMYDALNKGFSRASGEYFSWLNADEQYLPGTLEKVKVAFEQYPSADIVYGDSLVVDTDNRLICVRKGEPFRKLYLLNDCLHVLTCGMFFRRRIWDAGLRFKPNLRCAGENDFFLRALQGGAKTRYLPAYLAAFTVTGKNLGVSDRAKQELAQLHARRPRWMTIAKPVITLLRRLEKGWNGAYRMPPELSYELYEAEGEPRKKYTSTSVNCHWPA